MVLVQIIGLALLSGSAHAGVLDPALSGSWEMKYSGCGHPTAKAKAAWIKKEMDDRTYHDLFIADDLIVEETQSIAAPGSAASGSATDSSGCRLSIESRALINQENGETLIQENFRNANESCRQSYSSFIKAAPTKYTWTFKSIAKDQLIVSFETGNCKTYVMEFSKRTPGQLIDGVTQNEQEIAYYAQWSTDLDEDGRKEVGNFNSFEQVQQRVEEMLAPLGGYYNPEARLRDGSTALMNAARAGNVGLMKYLLAKGASPLATDKNGRSALDYAQNNNRSAAVALLKISVR